MNRPSIVIFTLIVVLLVVLVGLPRHDRSSWTLPLYAAPAQTETTQPQGMHVPIVDATPRAWLHVEVETSYGWFWQKSSGWAFTTTGGASRERVIAEELCIRLVAHDSTERCIANVDTISISERKRGLGIPKRTAYITAWANGPAMDTVRVQMAP